MKIINMEIKSGPNPVDESNLLYKLQRKLKVFNTSNPLPNRGYNLVASSSKYGLIFIGAPDGTLTVYHLSQLVDKECEPQHLPVKLQEKPTHIAVSCDQELLAVTGGQFLNIYKVVDFQSQNVAPSLSLKTDTNPSTFVSAIQWNPCIPDSIAIAFYDGTLLACQASVGQMKKVSSKARCICWSPKGKQIVTGNSDGTLCQYKPDLTPAKMVPTPNLFEGAPVEALAIYWISTYQFAVVFKNASDNSRPAVTIVNTPKAGQPTCINYEDICYSMGSNRPWYYYLQGIAQWNMILSSSSNGMEMATLATTDGANWLQWCQSDDSRPELPLTDKKIENYPVGICIDTSAIYQLPWGENELLSHMPLLLVVTQSGLLTIFNVINLNMSAMQLCSPPQLLQLPVAAMTSSIPDDAQPVAAPEPTPIVQPKPQPQFVQTHPPPVHPTPQYASVANPVFAPPNVVQPVGAPPQLISVQRQLEEKPVTPQSQPTAPQTHPLTPKQVAQTRENAALKAEQERLNKIKENQELKAMLVREVNEFQMELYNFIVKTKETQAKFQFDLDSINSIFNYTSLDAEQLKQECSLEDLRDTIVQLKLELVRACAAVAEARTHSNAKDFQDWTLADPLTAKRVSALKKLSYYVQTQLEQAQKALDHKWDEIMDKDPQCNKPGQHIIRPILDDVYRPLVKQQEILSRQQAVLKAFRSTLNQCDISPMFKSTSLLRSTPFKSKDPLSKLTKNILNLSIEPQTKTKEPLLTAHKLDALRDMLSNHKTVKIKPVNIELRQHMASMRLKHENSIVKEKTSSNYSAPIIAEPEVKVEIPAPTVTAVPFNAPAPNIEKIEPKINFIPEPKFEFRPETKPMLKPDLKSVLQTGLQPVQQLELKPVLQPQPKLEPVKQIPSSFTPVSNMKPAPGLNNVARTLFADEPKPEPKPAVQPQMPVPMKPPQHTFTPAPVSAPNTRNVLKDLLENKQANLDTKNNANTFMGQQICSPTSFSFSATPNTTAPASSFTAKPISDINSILKKIPSQAFASESKPPLTVSSKSNETGESEETVTKVIDIKPKIEVKPLTNLFGMKSSTPLAASTPVPDVLKSTRDLKADKINPIEKLDKPSDTVKPALKVETDKDNKEQPFTANKTVFGFTPSQPVVSNASVIKIPDPPQKETELPSVKTDVPLKVENKAEVKIDTENSTPSSSASSLFAAANASNPTSTSTASSSGTASTSTSETLIDSTKSSLFGTSTTSSTASIFGVSVSEPKTSSSVLTPTASIFGSTSQGSIFGATTTTAQSAGLDSTAQSVFSAASKQSAFNLTSQASPSSVFGTATTQTASGVFSSAASVFGTATTIQSVFGSKPATESSTFGTTTASVFSTPAVTQAPALETSATSTGFSSTTTTASVFGTTTSTQSIFGGTQSSVFGGTPPAQPSVFGTSVSSAQSSIFGTAPTTQSSVFGTPTQTSPVSVFGSSTQTTQASVFGAPQTTQASLFGTPTQATQSSLFGTPTQSTQASVFGTPPATTAQSNSLFGGAEANLFASASISTTSASSPSGGSIFGGGGSSGTVFGGSGTTNVFGGKTSFGQPNPTAASIFGGGASFGQNQANNFWGSGNTNTATSGFGSSAFGQTATTQASSLFGAAAGSAGPFGAPQAAFGAADPKPSVFGSPQKQNAPAFGGGAVFGSKPAFGQSGFGSPAGGSGFGSFGGFNKSPTSGFGAPAAFGAPAFGGSSPGTVFRGNAAGPAFGSPTQSNAMFESLATQNTLTFGNLAQQTGAAPAPAPAPAFNTSPSFTGWRG